MKSSQLDTAGQGLYHLSVTVTGGVLPRARAILSERAAKEAQRLGCQTWHTEGVSATESTAPPAPPSKTAEEGEAKITTIRGWIRCGVAQAAEVPHA